MMRNKLPQALPCLQITGLAAQVAEKYGLRPVPYSALRRVYDTRFPLPVQTRSPNGQMWVDRYYIVLLPADIGAAFSSALRQMRLQEKNIWISPRLNKSERLDVR